MEAFGLKRPVSVCTVTATHIAQDNFLLLLIKNSNEPETYYVHVDCLLNNALITCNLLGMQGYCMPEYCINYSIALRYTVNWGIFVAKQFYRSPSTMKIKLAKYFLQRVNGVSLYIVEWS